MNRLAQLRQDAAQAPELLPRRVEGAGWMVRTSPGARFAHVAVDLMHDERGLVARLYEHPGLRRSQRKQLSALADALAERLGAQRVGPRF